jgi:hypothetical protein
MAKRIESSVMQRYFKVRGLNYRNDFDMLVYIMKSPLYTCKNRSGTIYVNLPNNFTIIATHNFYRDGARILKLRNRIGAWVYQNSPAISERL